MARLTLKGFVAAVICMCGEPLQGYGKYSELFILGFQS